MREVILDNVDINKYKKVDVKESENKHVSYVMCSDFLSAGVGVAFKGYAISSEELENGTFQFVQSPYEHRATLTKNGQDCCLITVRCKLVDITVTKGKESYLDRVHEIILPLKSHVMSPSGVVDLSNKELEEFPRELLSWPEIIQLNLSRNNISKLPNDINRLSKLKVLELGDNYLNSLPASFWKMKTLERIYLYGNRFLADACSHKSGYTLESLEKEYSGIFGDKYKNP